MGVGVLLWLLRTCHGSLGKEEMEVSENNIRVREAPRSHFGCIIPVGEYEVDIEIQCIFIPAIYQTALAQ